MLTMRYYCWIAAWAVLVEDHCGSDAELPCLPPMALQHHNIWFRVLNYFLMFKMSCGGVLNAASCGKYKHAYYSFRQLDYQRLFPE